MTKTDIMNKHYFSSLAFVTLLCMMLLCMVSCKKEDGETPNPAEKDFFIDVDFLPKTETNGALAPRLMVNFNDEAVMIELRSPSASTPLESVLFLYPDNKAMMMCGNDNLMVCAEYDMETLAPSDDVLLVTQMDDNALLLTKCVMDWNTNTITKGDQMILPIDGTGKKRTGKGGDDDDMRWFFFNHFIKPLTEKLDQFESFCDIFPVPQGIVVTYIKTIISTAAPIILFSDDPESFIDAMEYPITSYTETAVQTGVLHFAPQDVSDMSSRILAGIGWYTSGGHGTVDENEGNGEASKLPFSTFYSQSSNATYAASQISALDPVYIVNLNVSNITENSAYLRGSFQFGNTSSSITPIEMGYIYKVSGGDEHTVEDMHFYGKTMSGLHKATKYTAYAYARSIMGDMVLSPAVTFKTLGFEAFPSSLTFPAEGDTKYVALSYSDEDITSWEITSKPSWCTIIVDDLGLLAVTVGETTEARNGIITITGHSNALGSVIQNITVTQLGKSGWDGTSWLFSGTVSYTSIQGSGSIPVENSVLVVNSVSNNDVEFDLATMLFSTFTVNNENYTIDGNGNLVYTANTSLGYYSSVDWQVTFVRIGPTTATANFYANETFQEESILTYSGVLQGTLMDANEQRITRLPMVSGNDCSVLSKLGNIDNN